MKTNKLPAILNVLILSGLYIVLSSFTQDTVRFANGADIGWLSEMEASGYKFYDNLGVQKNCMQILKEKGINSLRFRVWVNPKDGWCGKKDVARMAYRADSMGFRVMIDFHYSDWWADPGKQNKPAAWVNDTLELLLKHIYDHTYEVLDTLKSIGVTPEWVQVGNETNDGMLWPDGRASKSMKNFALMINSSYNAIKAVDSSINVIVHLSNGYKNSMFRWMFDGLKSNNAKWDIIGMSLYPTWANTNWENANNQCLSNMQDMVTRYNTKVMIVESGMPYYQEYDCNAFLLDLIAKVKSVPGGLGLFYWEPQCYNWEGYNLGAWKTNGRPSLAMDAFLGIAHIDTTKTSLKETLEQTISIHPNPVTDVLNIGGMKESTSIKIFTANGSIVFEDTLKTGNASIYPKLNSGIYFIKFTNQVQKEIRTLLVK